MSYHINNDKNGCTSYREMFWITDENQTFRDDDYAKKRKAIFRRQRARQRRGQFLKLAACIFAMIIIFAFSISFFSLKGKAEEEPKFKYYTSIEIKYGDTLWTIAERYMDATYYNRNSYIDELKSINHIHEEDEIIAGKMLIIPYYSTEYIAD